MEIPSIFMEVLVSYFQEMYDRGKLSSDHFESTAMTVLSMNFGFVFLTALFGEKMMQRLGVQKIVTKEKGKWGIPKGKIDKKNRGQYTKTSKKVQT